MRRIGVLPYTYTITWSRNHPYLTTVKARSHRVEGNKLVLTTDRSEDETFLDPQEWCREYMQGFTWDHYLWHGPGEFLERFENWEKADDAPRCVYQVESRLMERRVSVYADSHEQDGDTFRLLVKDKIVAEFDNPVSWRPHKLPESEGLSDDEI